MPEIVIKTKCRRNGPEDASWPERFRSVWGCRPGGMAPGMASDTQQVAMRYIDVMLEKVEACEYPSKELLDRIERAVVLFWDQELDEEQR